MYFPLLVIHSIVRWLVFGGLLFALYRAYDGKKKKRSFTKLDDRARHWAATLTHIQLLIGLWLYFVSPMVDYFLHHFTEGVHQREVRFFGMEHITMMLVSIVLLTIGSMKTKRGITDKQKFDIMFTWYLIVLVLIFLSIPWAFSPFTGRPYFRW